MTSSSNAGWNSDAKYHEDGIAAPEMIPPHEASPPMVNDEVGSQQGRRQRGWRRLIRNFTPSYVHPFPHKFINSSMTDQRHQLVLGHNGDRNRFNPPPQSSIQWSLALLDLRRCFRLECASLLYLLRYFILALRYISSDLDCHDSSSCSVALPRDVPYGSCHDYQHDRFCLCTFLGRLDYQLCKILAR